jgi:L-amino acid N-acyltransferase YncA
MPIRPLALGDLPGAADMWNGAIRASAITFAAEEKTGLGLAAWLVAGPPRVAAASGRRVWPQRLAAASGRRGGGGDGALLGFAAAGAFRPGPGPGHARVWERSVFVAGPARPSPARGQGVGAALIDALAGAGRAARIGSLMAV